MFSASIPDMLFAFTLLTIFLQNITAVAALPTTPTPPTARVTQLETRQPSGSNLTNINNNYGNGNNNNVVLPNDTTSSHEVSPSQIVGVAVGALCIIALALILWYFVVLHRRRRQELRAAQEKAVAIENTKRADPSYVPVHEMSADARSLA